MDLKTDRTDPKSTARHMSVRYKETSLGGLATSVRIPVAQPDVSVARDVSNCRDSELTPLLCSVDNKIDDNRCSTRIHLNGYQCSVPATWVEFGLFAFGFFPINALCCMLISSFATLLSKMESITNRSLTYCRAEEIGAFGSWIAA